MQTFLPYKSFSRCAEVLDMKRLGKQRVEAWQIYNSIINGTGWKHHPIVKMWKGYEPALLMYGIAMCDEWIKRGYKDSMRPKFLMETLKYRTVTVPKWLNCDLCISHQSNLLRKNKEHYSKYFFNVPNDLPYVWAVNKERVVDEYTGHYTK